MSIAEGVGRIFASANPASMRGVGFRWRSIKIPRAAPRSFELAIEDGEPRRRIANRAGHENIIARAREVASHHSARGLAQKRDRDRKAIGAGDVAADDVGPVTPRDLLDSGV